MVESIHMTTQRQHSTTDIHVILIEQMSICPISYPQTDPNQNHKIETKLVPIQIIKTGQMYPHNTKTGYET